MDDLSLERYENGVTKMRRSFLTTSHARSAPLHPAPLSPLLQLKIDLRRSPYMYVHKYINLTLVTSSVQSLHLNGVLILIPAD